MNFLADESVDYPVVAVAEMAPSISDDLVLAQANQRAVILLTGGKDFGELVFRQHWAASACYMV